MAADKPCHQLQPSLHPTAYRQKYIEMLKAAPNDRKLHDPEKYNAARPSRERGLMGKANRMNIVDQNSDFSI